MGIRMSEARSMPPFTPPTTISTVSSMKPRWYATASPPADTSAK
jgi:hypothetical protein